MFGLLHLKIPAHFWPSIPMAPLPTRFNESRSSPPTFRGSSTQRQSRDGGS